MSETLPQVLERHGKELDAAMPYANSPAVWSVCGYIRAAGRGSAQIQAAFKVGSSRVRVIPEGPN